MEIKISGDGSHTLYVPDMDEPYHSLNGAITESTHVFIRNGFNNCWKDHINVFEVGFGTGLNALLTYIEAIGRNVVTTYHSIELKPLTDDIYGKLNYPSELGNNIDDIFSFMHTCEWNKSHPLNSYFVLHKIQDDFVHYELTEVYDIIYFDAFAPDKQSEMWTQQIFNKLFHHLSNGGILTTYSAKGEVKRKLVNAGFSVEYLPGPPGKREMIRALKN